MAASADRRARAERKAAMGAMLVALKADGVKEGERFALVRKRFGSKGTSRASLKRLQRQVQGIDPINYAPALLDDYKATVKRAEFSEEAWRFFLSMIRDAAPDWPLKEAYRRVRDTGSGRGWAVPSYQTFRRRWTALSEVERMQARFGTAEAAKRLAMPALRDKTTLMALEQVSLDGRTLDFWVDWGDGKPFRPTMLALVDVLSNTVIGWELAKSENATSTVRVIKRTCERYGIFDRLYTDNSRSFSGHKVAGGAEHRFRNGAPNELKHLGICEVMGIEITFADANRTDHERLMKLVAEGKAFYQPAKSEEEREAERRAEATPVIVCMSVPRNQLKRMKDAADDAESRLWLISRVFSLMSHCAAEANDPDGLSAALRLLSIATENLSDTESAALSNLGLELARASEGTDKQEAAT